MERLLLLATLCSLCLPAVLCADAAIPLHVEPFDDGYEVSHVAMMTTSFSVAGVLVLVVVGGLAWRKKASLATLLLVAVLAAVVVVGVVSWIITYVKLRDEMQEKVRSLIILAGIDVEVSVRRTLETGETVVRLYEKMHAYEVTSMNDSFPAPINRLHAVRHAFVGKDATVTGLYYGTKWGYSLALWPRAGGHLDCSYGFPATAPLSELQHFSCRGWDHADAGCDAVNCSTSARLNCGETCLIYNATNCFSQHTGTNRVIYYGTEWGKTLPASLRTLPRTFAYDVRTRPWYADGMAAGGRLVWTAPYAPDGQRGDVTPLGVTFSAVQAIRNVVTGELEGVFAVDYMLESLHGLLAGLRPTEHAAILMCGLEGILYASSAFASDVAQLTLAADAQPANVFTHHRPEIRDVFFNIQRVVGSLNEASQLRRLIQLPDSTLLVSPLNMTGKSLIVVIVVPHKDILGAVNDASTIALAFVMTISVVLAGLVSGLTYVLVSKLKRLSRMMHNVAWMNLKASQVPEADSIVSEIHSMQASFALLAKNMIEYKQYLPQSLLADSAGDDTTGSDAIYMEGGSDLSVLVCRTASAQTRRGTAHRTGRTEVRTRRSPRWGR